MQTQLFIITLSVLLQKVICQRINDFPLELNSNDQQLFNKDANKWIFQQKMNLFSCQSDKLYLRGDRSSNQATRKLDTDIPFYSVTVELEFFRIDSWDTNEDFFEIQINQQRCMRDTYTYQRCVFYSCSKCGNDKYDENVINIKCSVSTNISPINITLIATLNDDIKDESWAFRNLKASALKCYSLCKKCENDPQNCLDCFSGYYLSTNKCLLCDPSCDQCKNSSTNCTKCKAGTYLLSKKIFCQFNDNLFIHQLNNLFILNQINNLVITRKQLYNLFTSINQFIQLLLIYLSINDDQQKDQKCVKECPQGFIKNYDSLICEKCPQDCQNCSSTTSCDTCNSGFFRTPDNKCVKLCIDNFYGDPLTHQCSMSCSKSEYFKDSVTKQCQKCASSCLTCDIVSTNCKSCLANTFINKTQCTLDCSSLTNSTIQECVSICPQDGLYSDLFKQECLPCYKGCKKCTGPQFNQCTECNTNYLQDKTKCLKQDCGDYFFTDANTNECKQCLKECKTCKDDTGCVTCIVENNENKCINPCTNGQYYNSSDHKCYGCNKSCKECFGSEKNMCTECNSGMKIVNGACVCDQGYYQIQSTGSGSTDQIECKSCESAINACQECQINQSGKVVCSLCSIQNMISVDGICKCNTGFTLNNTQCECQDGLFLFENSCYPCNPSCKTCLGPKNSDCATCQMANSNIDNVTKLCTCIKGYFFNTIQQECQKCHPTCQNCMTSDKADCFMCGSGLIQQNFTTHTSGEITNTCSCPKGLYFDSNLGKCNQCHPSCRECNEGEDVTNCLSCYDPLMNFTLNAPTDMIGKCDCIETYFFNLQTKTCQKCHFSCQTCIDNSSSKCLSCSDPNATLSGNVCICKTGYYFDNNICQLCHSDCKSCLGNKSSDCTSCSSADMSPSTSTDSTGSPISRGKCICSNGLYYNESKATCIQCFGNCKKCDGILETNCLECAEGTNFIKNEYGKCVCESGYYEPIVNSGQRQCLSCNKLCKSCDQNGKCDQCKSSCMKVTADRSTCQCITGYAFSDQECYKCPPMCSSCKVQPISSNSNLIQCLSCNDSRTMVLATDSSKCECRNKYYTYGDQCIACSSICASCSGNTDKDCIKCADQINMKKDAVLGICTCQDDLVFDQSTNRCVFHSSQQCRDASCLKCNKSECFKCLVNYSPQGDRCVCRQGYYDIGNMKGCMRCEQENCTSCTNADSCDKCDAGMIQYQGKCFCPDSMFKDVNDNCSKQCPPKCKMCLDPLTCYLTRDEANKQDYAYCDVSCEMCSNAEYYSCWKCSSETRVYDQTQRTCFCRSSYKEIYQKECLMTDRIESDLTQIFSLSSPTITFASIILSTFIDSTSAAVLSDISGFSSLFMYSFVQYQQIGNLLFINKALPLDLEQNYYHPFLQMNLFINIPASLTPLNQQNTQLNRQLDASTNQQHDHQSPTSDILENFLLFNNPKFSLYKLDRHFFTISFYPLLFISFTFLIIAFLSIFANKYCFLQQIHEKAKWNLNLKAIIFVSNICLLSSFINIKYMLDYSKQNQIDLATICLFCTFYFSGLLYLFYKINFSSITANHNSSLSFSCLHSQICQENFFSKNFWLLIETRKVIQTIIIVFAQAPVACVWTITTFCTLISVIIFLRRPFLSRPMNIFLLNSEISIILQNFAMSILVTFPSSVKITGYMLICFTCIFQLNSLISCIYFFTKWLIQFVSSKRNSIESSSPNTQFTKKILATPKNHLSLELQNAQQGQKFECMDELDNSFRDVDYNVKWKQNPLLLNRNSKLSTKQQTKNSILSVQSFAKKKSTIQGKVIEQSDAYKFHFQDKS